VDYPPTLPDFDPDLHPLGYALALELSTKSSPAIPSDHSEETPKGAVDRFGWEFDSEAA
jgi:hypothetical protein